METFVPQADPDQFAADTERIRAAAATEGGVQHVRSYLVPGDEMGIHVMDADSAESVRRVAEVAGIRVERVVVAFDVSSGGSEGS